MRFRTILLQGEKTATGIRVPDEIVTALGAGKKPAVQVTIRGYTFRTTIAVRNFRGRPTVPPRFITREPRGNGFAEAASLILSRRAAP